MKSSIEERQLAHRRELAIADQSHDTTGTYLSDIQKKQFNVTWRDMALKDLFRLISSNRSSFKCLVMSSSLVKEWHKNAESLEDKNHQMLTTGVDIVACINLQRSEAYSFATLQEGYAFDVMIAALIYQGISKRSAISMAYRNIGQKNKKKS